MKRYEKGRLSGRGAGTIVVPAWKDLARMAFISSFSSSTSLWPSTHESQPLMTGPDAKAGRAPLAWR